MKTNKVDKKEKKQSVSESPEKSHIKKKSKKPNFPTVFRNQFGEKYTYKSREQALKEIAQYRALTWGNPAHKEALNQRIIPDSLKPEIKSPVKNESKPIITAVQKETKKVDKRAVLKKVEGKPEVKPLKTEAQSLTQEKQQQEKRPLKYSNLSAEALKRKIEEINSRETVTKTAKRKLAVFARRLREFEPTSKLIVKKTNIAVQNNKKEKPSQEIAKPKQEANANNKTKVQKKKLEEKPQNEPQQKKVKTEKVKLEEDDSSLSEDDDDDDCSCEMDSYSEERDDDEDEPMESKGDSEEDDEDDAINDEDDDDEEDDDDDDDDESESEEEEEIVEKEIIKKVQQNKKKEIAQPFNQKKKVIENRNRGAFQKAGKVAGGIPQKKKPFKKGK